MALILIRAHARALSRLGPSGGEFREKGGEGEGGEGAEKMCGAGHQLDLNAELASLGIAV